MGANNFGKMGNGTRPKFRKLRAQIPEKERTREKESDENIIV